MTIFEALKADHTKAKQTLEDLIEITAVATDEHPNHRVTQKTWRELLISLTQALTAHDRAEEATFYEALRERAHLPEFADGRTDEHRAVEEILAALARLGPHHHDWGTQLSLLKSQLEAHIAEEETSIFDAVEHAISEDDAYHMAEAFYSLRYENADGRGAPAPRPVHGRVPKASGLKKSGGTAARPR